MGNEDRDWYREERRASRGSQRGVLAGLAIGIVLVLAASPPVSTRLGYTPPLGVSKLYPEDRGAQLQVELLPGTRGIGAPSDASPYPLDDPWREWLAKDETCPRGEDTSAPPAVQVQVLLCLVNFARNRESLRPLALPRALSASAGAKALDIVRCREFEHEACGLSPQQRALDVGYLGPFGENLYMGEGPWRTPRLAVHGWLNSDGHRENLFRSEWSTIGIALLGDADIRDIREGVVWVNHLSA